VGAGRGSREPTRVSTTLRSAITTVDPSTGRPLADYEAHTSHAIDAALERAATAFRSWRMKPFDERATFVRAAAAELRERKTELATFATREMGKTLAEAEAEVEKSAVGCEYYADSAATHLADQVIATSAAKSYVGFRPLGVVLAIMPWNFPYWQVFRAAAPALMAGNVVVLKHAANVTGCALEIERIFKRAGFPEGTFTTLVVAGGEMEAIVADPRIAAVTLTGSEGAGSAVAATAGKHLKKTVLELGGSDAFIVLNDADIAAAAKMALRARFQNNGQSCIAAKRFIIEAESYEAFCSAFVAQVRTLRIGNPLERDTTLGPLAREDLRAELERQIDGTLRKGGKLCTGGHRVEGAGYYFEPTVVADVTESMSMFEEETFGPAAALIRARNLEDCIALANASRFGLGGNLWTGDLERAQHIAARLESGAVFVNGMTASDPRLPFGGVKKSGYGRELGSFGIQEFVNAQTVWIGPASDAHQSAVPAE
jgi:acyl-CoA reductase-like NAD-dependent aldehyde dehydrogenase